MAAPRLAIVSDFDAWHEAELRAACARRGVEARIFSLSDGAFAATADGCELRLPGFAPGELPDALLVRFIPGGSFEQVTLYLSLLHALDHLGVPVYNPARAIERTVDKAMCSFLLTGAGVATPPTWATVSAADAAARLATEIAAGHRLVLKPLFGARGQGLKRLDSADPDALAEAADATRGVYYLQRFIAGRDAGGRDWRVLVIGGRARAAMLRRSDHWISNRARGGVCLPAELSETLARPAERAAAAVGARYAGVDLIRDRDGRVLVLEVNGVPAWQGLQSVNPDCNIAEQLIDDLLSGIAY